jgi:hypothetical protein
MYPKYWIEQVKKSTTQLIQTDRGVCREAGLVVDSVVLVVRASRTEEPVVAAASGRQRNRSLSIDASA